MYGCFEAFLNHPPTYVRTFSLHKVRENCHFLDHPPTPMPLRNIKMAPNPNPFSTLEIDCSVSTDNNILCPNGLGWHLNKENR